jgi:site-specific DNA recombinase
VVIPRSEGYYREEVLADQFAEIVGNIHLDHDVVEWVRDALTHSLADETAHHRDALGRLTRELEQVKRRMNQAYLDKLDGTITQDFWAEHAAKWQAEKARLMEELARHEQADDQYLHTGVRVLELAERARELYLRQDAGNRRQLHGFLLQQCTLQAGRLTPTYRQPFDILARMASEAHATAARRGRSSKIASWGG